MEDTNSTQQARYQISRSLGTGYGVYRMPEDKYMGWFETIFQAQDFIEDLIRSTR
jgi:hypothetical protein